jgi:nucleolar protein 6
LHDNKKGSFEAAMPSDRPAHARLTKKQKKATAFRERTGKGKGKLNPVPRTKTGGDDDDDDDANALPAMEDQGLAGDAGDAAGDTEGDEGRVKSSKAASLGAGETSKKKRRGREDGEAQGEPVAKRARGSKKIPTPADDEGDEARAGVNEAETGNEGGKQRFILFVGMSAIYLLPMH